VDTPPGNERIAQSIIALADAVVIPTRAGGVEYSRVIATLDLIPTRIPRGVVFARATRTNDLEAAITWWKEQKIEIWGVIPERVGIAAGPNDASAARASRVTTPYCIKRYAGGVKARRTPEKISEVVA